MAEEKLVDYIISDIDHALKLSEPPAQTWLIVSTPFTGESATRVKLSVEKARNVKVEFTSSTEITIFFGDCASVQSSQSS